MKQTKILLCCGAGMSSGFLANNARKAAKKKNIDVNIEARSAADVGSYMSSIDVLMIGPHYENEMPEFKKMAEPYNVSVVVIPKKIYSMLNGEAVLELAMREIENNQ